MLGTSLGSPFHLYFFFQAEDGIRDLVRSRGLGDVYKRQHISKTCGLSEQSIMLCGLELLESWLKEFPDVPAKANLDPIDSPLIVLSLIHI